MTFIESVKTCFRKYAVFKGRATRSEFWWFQLFVIVTTIVATMFDNLILGYDWLESDVTPMAVLVDTLTVVPIAAVTARRLHDVGRSGWWQLPNFLFYLLYLDVFLDGFSSSGFMSILIFGATIYWFGLLLFLIKDSQPHTNAYGPNPKSPEMASVFG